MTPEAPGLGGGYRLVADDAGRPGRVVELHVDVLTRRVFGVPGQSVAFLRHHGDLVVGQPAKLYVRVGGGYTRCLRLGPVRELTGWGGARLAPPAERAIQDRTDPTPAPIPDHMPPTAQEALTLWGTNP